MQRYKNSPTIIECGDVRTTQNCAPMLTVDILLAT